MLLGDQNTFAIECHHDPLPNESKRIFGRMCLWVAGTAFGDIQEPACMLDVTAGHLQRAITGLQLGPEPVLDELDDRSLFDFLDRKLYLDDGRPSASVADDARTFFRFDFLTNGGDSFDHTKSFIVREDVVIRILFTDRDSFHAGHVSVQTFEDVIASFFRWLESERDRAG